jgi:hypothetical protein
MDRETLPGASPEYFAPSVTPPLTGRAGTGR